MFAAVKAPFRVVPECRGVPAGDLAPAKSKAILRLSQTFQFHPICKGIY
jgi:hypothetical protein